MGKNLLIFVLFAGIGYFAYQHWIAPQPTPAAPTPPVAAEVASAPAPVTTPTPPPTPAAAPAPAPLPSATATAAGAPGSENSGFVSTTPADAQAAAASAPAPAGPETKLIETNVTGYDLNNPINALGVFKAGSELTLADSKITGMKEVVFHAPDGTDIHALCFVKDLNRKAPPVIVADHNPVESPQQQEPVETAGKGHHNAEPRAWIGEPNWQHVDQNPNYHGIGH